ERLSKGNYMSKKNARGMNARNRRDRRVKSETPAGENWRDESELEDGGHLAGLTVVPPDEAAQLAIAENHLLCVGGPYGGAVIPLALIRLNSQCAIIGGENYCFMRGSKKRPDNFAVLFLQWMPSV
ncbi:MAG: hypothetical protein NUW01_13860, partial [Gemmatimonadaceae bacterium]|nr:hypothetical protein [Gemmatimonadaceae bacterium]